MKPKFKVGDVVRWGKVMQPRILLRKILRVSDYTYYYVFKNSFIDTFTDNVKSDPIKYMDEEFHLDKESLWNKQLKELLNNE